MNKLDQTGGLLLSVLFAITLMLLVAVSGFGVWAYGERSDYKNNVDQKIATAIEVAKQETSTAKDNEFNEREKLPLQPYQGPTAYGSVMIQYPKSWSAYVDEAGSGSPVNGYFHPGFVPGVSNDKSYALRLEVSDKAYSEELKHFDSDTKNGKVTVQAYRSLAAEGTVGARLDGEVSNKKQGAMILIPLRDKTLKIWTESQQFVNDFNTLILPNLSFVP